MLQHSDNTNRNDTVDDNKEVLEYDEVLQQTA